VTGPIELRNHICELAHHVDRIYQAAVAPEYWPVFLDGLRAELQLASLHLVFRHPCDGDRGIVASTGMDGFYEDAYRFHYYQLNPWRPFGPEAKEGRALLCDGLLPESEILGTEFYNDWMRPQGIADPFVAFLCNAGPGEAFSELVGFPEKSRKILRDEDLEPVRSLIPHLQRALGIHSRVQDAEIRAGAAAEALDRISGGVILLDERGSAIVTNRSADRILALNDGLALNWDGPRASTPKQTAELRRLLAGAANTGAGNGEDAGAVLRLARPSGRPALEAVVTPIGRESSALFDHRAVAAIFVAEPDAQAERPAARLRRLYGLTRMEAEVASRLATGMDPSEIAEALGITIYTVRGHLKQLFTKTDTHRQAELVRVILAGPARIRPD
jgi:DNA-binding CsgD family transcriptional regulator